MPSTSPPLGTFANVIMTVARRRGKLFPWIIQKILRCGSFTSQQKKRLNFHKTFKQTAKVERADETCLPYQLKSEWLIELLKASPRELFPLMNNFPENFAKHISLQLSTTGDASHNLRMCSQKTCSRSPFFCTWAVSREAEPDVFDEESIQAELFMSCAGGSLDTSEVLHHFSCEAAWQLT